MGTIAITLNLIGWSSIPLFLKYFADHIDAWTSNGWRYGFAAFLWAPVLIIGLLGRTLPRGLFRAAIIPSIVNSIGQVCFVWAHYKIDPGVLTFGLRTQLIFAAIGAYILFPGERRVIRTRSYIIGALAVTLGTGGALLLSDERPDMTHTAGILLATVSGFWFAAYALSVRHFMKDFNSVVAFAAISQYTAFAMIVLMLMFGVDSGLTAITNLTPGQFALLLISAVIGIAMGHVLYYISIARLGIAISAGVLQLHPFLVAIGSYLIFAEVLTIAQWISGLIAVGGAVLMLTIQGRLARARVNRTPVS